MTTKVKTAVHARTGGELETVGVDAAVEAGGGGAGHDGGGGDRDGGGGGRDSEPPSGPPSSGGPRPTAAAVERLRGRFPGHTFAENGPLVRVNDQLDLHPDFLSSRADADLAEIVEVAARVRQAPGGDPARVVDPAVRAKLSDDVAKVTRRWRLRFPFHLNAQVDAMLAQFDLVGHFENLTPEGRARLWDTLNERTTPRSPAKLSLGAQQEKMAVKWARGETRDAFVFVDRFQHWNAIVDNACSRMEKSLNDGLETPVPPADGRPGKPKMPEGGDARNRERISQWCERNLKRRGVTDLGDARIAIWENVLDSDLTKEADQKWDHDAKGVAGRTGSATSTFDLPNDQLVATIRATKELRFAGESSAIYHPDKPGHWDAIPADHKYRTGSHFEDYMLSANETIRSAPNPTVDFNPDGSKRLLFAMKYGDGANARTMEALVRVGREGNLSLLTYFTRTK